MPKKVARDKGLKEQIYVVIESEWPIHITGIAKKLGFNVTEENQKQVVARIRYHLRQLEDEERIRTKKVSRALIAWPHEVEKIRFVHEMLK